MNGFQKEGEESLVVRFRSSYRGTADEGIGIIASLPMVTVLSDSATPSNLNASNFLTVKDNIMLNPIFGMLSSRAIQNITNMLGYL